jgi:hypothetical protein
MKNEEGREKKKLLDKEELRQGMKQRRQMEREKRYEWIGRNRESLFEWENSWEGNGESDRSMEWMRERKKVHFFLNCIENSIYVHLCG